MSTLKSTPPTDSNRSYVIGCNGQPHYDPFLPSSPSEDDFFPLTSDISSGLGSSHTPSPSPFTNLTDLDLRYTPPSQTISPNQFYPFPDTQLPSSGFHEPSAASVAYDLNGIASSKDAFPNPSIYPAENGYTALTDGSETLNGEDALILEYALSTDPGQGLTADIVPNEQDQFSFRPTNADTHKSNYIHRASTGTTTQSSHLMSPVLTDKSSPDPRIEAASPPLLEHRAQDRGLTSMAGLNGEEDNMENIHLSGPMQHTPALTGTSMANSPDHTFVPLNARAASPMVLVESYRRGDSPARVSPRSGSKRRGSASSFLSVLHDGDLSDDGEGDTLKASSEHLGMPRHTRLSTGGDLAAPSEGRAGLDPEARAHIGDVQVLNFKDQEEANQLSEKIADVHDWLARSETGSTMGAKESPSLAPVKSKGISRRRRAKSASETSLSYANLMRLGADPSLNAGHHIPGPGLPIREDSVNDESDSDTDPEELTDDEEQSRPESPPAIIEVGNPLYEGSRNFRAGETGRKDSSPPPLFRAKLWQDPWYDSIDPGVNVQPVTSNEAIMKYNQCAEKIETMSRVATWGTRRMSESDVAGLFHRFTFNEKDRSKPKGERQSSFFNAAAKLLPKRRGSLLKRKESEASKAQGARSPDVEQSKRDSVGSRKESLGVPGSLQRKASLTKSPKSPKINTGSAVAAMGNQFASLGASGSISATGASSPTNTWTSAKNVIRRSRSRSDVRGGVASPVNLASLWVKQGGPPMPALASPPNVKDERLQSTEVGEYDDDDEDDAAEEKGVTIDFSIRADPITPTLEGFKSNVRQLNPRLQVYMIERVAQEQLRRYKKLVDFKVKHVQATSKQSCPSDKHCLELGGEPTYLPSKSTSKEPEQSHTGFSVVGLPPSDDDVNTLAEGIVTPAQFPPGVPMPPVKRLPAEFECSLCFKVKKFHKPSDWSKHVHEDVQPFTCTFPYCAEPKSFKRKADWVRHENERHRQLEWWQCNMNECTHKCYRKDNFVQHLVREHKLPEPRLKTVKASKPAVRGPSSQKTRKQQQHGDDANPANEANAENDQVWKLVEECRHETLKSPQDEPCKFCGNVCSSWKKLTVHLAKHMEQISMPVLDVVKEKDVTPETIVSPMEQRFSRQTTNSPPIRRSLPENSRVASGISQYGKTVQNPGMEAKPQSVPAAGSFPPHQPSTYPPPVPSPNQGPRYPFPGVISYDAAYYTNESASNAPFNAFNSPGGYGQLSSSGADNSLYGAVAGSLTSEPRSTSLMKEDMYQAVYPVKQQHQQQQHQHQHQHQQTFSNMPGDASMYVYTGSVTSFAAQQPSMNAPVQMQYNPMSGMTYSQAQSGSTTHFPAKPLSGMSQQQQQDGFPYS